MKKLIATVAIIGSTFTLSACGTSGLGNVDNGPPYTDERTATHSTHVSPAPVKRAAPVRAERVFREVQSK